ncbi:MAG: carbon dioxide-concentrating mechanism protein CcmK [Microcoleus sp.]|jgi:carbon dioxide concentrating mechanism protein CcmK|uniref:carbon dioxide-concentrating mechanism protein CcmK n=1 Tax=unclassified Microcoleus TaxID=2642155 RepID=UPI000E8C5488|nr:carbon dioxide-concentrating mechanism protein CcmK [Microcoleus sp. SU_5_3]NJL69452.1 carbon dioxide-concentrating mechanism protein CcmK [Microcoleus sp. SM1_3_4]NJM61638.1 carbon dioxide-concentrating mechanism protein CcmK [Oscillatoriales cyanobacterium RU_3_3]NJR23041.1 carbon dioxide-concentrating mechanism protein CcmK [Richelia sp. CSU_2_1]NJS12295.1 carbon dioxide-concentrating mechanism protein CcmK [Microcoleus sp. CSU_2_2]TAG87347.1 MAG: carbon dioxide-concentrating mechanism p
MGVAVGMVEVLGLPSAVEVADSMVKAARVTLVRYEKITRAYWTVIVRGDISEVQAAVAAGIESVKKVDGGKLLSYHIIARPHENLDYVLPIGYTPEVEQFRM